MRNYKFLVLFFLIPALMFWGCSDSTSSNKDVNEYEVLVEYLEGDGGDFINTTYTAIVGADHVKQNLGTAGQYLIDIRGEADYNLGHVSGAVRVDFANLLTHVEALTSSPDEIIIICYSGQTAAYGASLLRLMGHNNVYSMKFGMTSWNSAFDRWTSKCSNAYATQFETTSNAKGPAVEPPVIETGEKEGPAILRARVNELLAAGFGTVTISAATVFINPANYYINNYWPNDQYLNPGHIPGAKNYLPKQDLKSSTYLNTLPTDQQIVSYCYTGQGSAFLTAYLRVLGYDAYSLTYGANSMIYDLMPASKFSNAAIMEYEYVN